MEERVLDYKYSFWSKSDLKTIPFNVTKYGVTSYKIVPAQTLAPGDYAFTPPGETNDTFSFGVD